MYTENRVGFPSPFHQGVRVVDACPRNSSWPPPASTAPAALLWRRGWLLRCVQSGAARTSQRFGGGGGVSDENSLERCLIFCPLITRMHACVVLKKGAAERDKEKNREAWPAYPAMVCSHSTRALRPFSCFEDCLHQVLARPVKLWLSREFGRRSRGGRGCQLELDELGTPGSSTLRGRLQKTWALWPLENQRKGRVPNSGSLPRLLWDTQTTT